MNTEATYILHRNKIGADGDETNDFDGKNLFNF